MSIPGVGQSTDSQNGPGHSKTQALATPPGKGKTQLALAPAEKLEFWVRFMYYNPKAETWDYLPADIECWMCTGDKDTVCGQKIRTVAAPRGTKFEGPKPAAPADVAFVLNFGANKGIDPNTGKLVDAPTDGSLYVPLPDLWVSAHGWCVQANQPAFYQAYHGTGEGTENAPLDILLPRQVLFYDFGVRYRGSQIPLLIPPDKLTRPGNKKSIPLKKGTDFDGTFFESLAGPPAEAKFGFKVALDEIDGKPPRYDLDRQALVSVQGGDPAPNKVFAYLKKEFDADALGLNPKQVVCGSEASPYRVTIPAVFSPHFVRAQRRPRKKDGKYFLVCGDEVTVESHCFGLKFGAPVEGEIFERADDGTETQRAVLTDGGQTVSNDGSSPALQATWKVKTALDYLPMANGRQPEEKRFFARFKCDGIEAHSNESLLVRRIPDFPDYEPFDVVPVHPCPPFVDLTAKYDGKLTADELLLKIRVRYKVGWVRYRIKLGTDKHGNAKWVWGKLGKDNKLRYWDVGVFWDSWEKYTRANFASYAGADANVKQVVFVDDGAGGRTIFRGAGPVSPPNYPDPADMKVKDTQTVAAALGESKNEVAQVWSEKFYVKRKGCQGPEECCRWKIKVELSISETEPNPHYEIVLVPSAGRASVICWYTHEFTDIGRIEKRRANVHAHEVGHMMGAFDEYAGGGLNPIPSQQFVGSGTVMDNLSNRVEPRHMIDAAEFMRQAVQRKLGVQSWRFEIRRV